MKYYTLYDSETLCCVKEARRERPYFVLFCLYEMFRIGNSTEKEKLMSGFQGLRKKEHEE